MNTLSGAIGENSYDNAPWNAIHDYGNGVYDYNLCTGEILMQAIWALVVCFCAVLGTMILLDVPAPEPPKDENEALLALLDEAMKTGAQWRATNDMVNGINQNLANLGIHTKITITPKGE